MSKSRVGAAAVLALCAACAETNAPLPEPIEVLLVVNRESATLSVIPVDQPASAVDVPLGVTPGTPTGVSARDSLALVPLGTADAVAVVHLHALTVLRTIPLATGSGATGSAIVSESVGYVADPGRNTVTAVNLWTGDTAAVAVGTTPQGVAFTRGRVFVLNGNLVEPDADPAPPLPSWITVIDPETNARATGIDSIPLTGPGNARFAALGSDGLLYVVSAGAGAADGRLAIVDPVARIESASFAGFGATPGNPASDGDDRVFVSSRTEGVMEFDARLRSVTRGTGAGVAIPTNSAVAVDSRGRIYAIEAGACTAGSPGVAHVLGADLVEIRTIPLGDCPIAATIVKVPRR